jgi:hypothetical protein
MMKYSIIPIALIALLVSAGAIPTSQPKLRGKTIEPTSNIDSTMARKRNPDQSGYMNFEIRDAKHGKAIVSGFDYNGDIYHLQESNGENHDRWAFVPVPNEDGYYYIYELRHFKALVASDKLDGNLYHADPAGKDYAKWRAEPVPGNNGFFFFYDKKHDKAICGGDTYDGDIYHQDPDDRKNCQWNLLDPRDTAKPGPMFYTILQHSTGGSGNCTAGELDFHFSLTTDYYGYETSWRLENSKGQFFAGEENLQSDLAYNTWKCIPDDSYKLTIYDSNGDGLNGGTNPGYTLTVDGSVVEAYGVNKDHPLDFGNEISFNLGKSS